MNGHLTGLLGIVAVQLAAIFADQTTPLPAKLAAAAGTLVTLLFANPATQAKAVTILVAFAALAVPVLTFTLTKMTPGTFAANLSTTLVAVFVQLPRVLSNAPKVPPAGVALVLLGLLAGCHGVKTDQVIADVVDCATVNPETSGALAAVLGCANDVAAGDPAGCLDDVLASARWAAAEVRCVAAYVASQSKSAAPQQKLAASAWLSRARVVTANLFPAASGAR